jgi:hypothetical protein
MKFRAFVLFISAAAVALTGSLAQTPPAHRAANQKAANQKAAKKKSAAKTPVRRTASVPRQATPTPQRYKEIQDALRAKGYLKSEGTGAWDAESTDALKRYQADNKEEPTGKITAASLIGLGLGPKTAYLSSQAAAPPAPAVP